MLLIALTLASLATATATPARLATSTLSRRYVAQDGGCRPGDTLCSPANENGTGGWCVDLLTDPNNCGACDKGCFSGFGRCINGYCPHNDPNACEPGLTGCEGGPTAAFPFTCMDLQSNRENCGACFVRCRDDQSCKAGQCIEDPNAPPLPPQPWTTCEKDFKWCDGGCVNTDNDNMNCGGCRNMGQNCVDGQCTPETTCPQDYCGGVGCVNKQNDNRHCGKCFNMCEPGKNCDNGQCS